MISKLLISLVFAVLILAAGTFVVLSVWDIPVTQEVVEKPLESSKVLEKKS